MNPASYSAAHGEAGFSLVELIFAVVILAVGLLGLGGTTAYLTRQATLADLKTERSAALIAAVERIRATDYPSIAASSDTLGGYEVNVTVNELANAKVVLIETVGPGLASISGSMPILKPSVADTFTYRVLRP